MKYDVFISYRREGGFETANLIAMKLRSKGYSVFFDVESLRSGKFNEQLYNVMESCTDFVLVLPKDALDRCNTEGDWLSNEICHAMKHNKNIIPVMLSGFSWPEQMPKGMEGLNHFQGVAASSFELFNESMDRLAGYLQSRPTSRMMVRKVVGIIAILVAVAAIAFAGIRFVASSKAKDVANYYTAYASVIHEYATDANHLKNQWNRFAEDFKTAKTEDRKLQLAEDFIAELENSASEAEKLKNSFPAELQISSFDKFLIESLGVQTTDIQALPIYKSDTYNSFINLIVSLQESALNFAEKGYSSNDAECNSLLFKNFSQEVNLFYYGYLEELTLIPESAQEAHKTLSKQWANYPNVPSGMTKEQYRELQQKELEQFNYTMARLDNLAINSDNQMHDLENQLDDIESKLESK